MFISVESENIGCNSFEEYEKCIFEKMQLKDAEIWISENGTQDDYPCLGILVKDDCVVINYFGEDETNFVTVGNNEDEEIVSFCNEQYEVAGYQIIDKKSACIAIMDFFLTKDKSDKLEWEEL